MAINAIEKEGFKGSLRGKFKRASWGEDDLSRLLTLFRNPISLGNRPEYSPHASKASSRRARKLRRRVFSPPGSHKTLSQRSNLPRIATLTRSAGEFSKRLDCWKNIQLAIALAGGPRVAMSLDVCDCLLCRERFRNKRAEAPGP
jgi:hypothetical protein